MAIGQRRPTEHEKKLLVKYKNYASVNDIPEFVPLQTLQKMHRFYRFRIATYMTIGCLFGSLIYGKGAEFLMKEQENGRQKENSG